MSRLMCGEKRTVTFIWGREVTVLKVFRNGKFSPNIKIETSLALKMYNEFIRLGAERIV